MADGPPEGWSPAHPAQAWTAPPEHWPAGVKAISMGGLDLLGVDDTGRLYWDGKPVEVAKTFGLSAWQKAGALVTVCAAVVGAAAAVISTYLEWVKT